jgi:lipopolysaccharide/colanic/teichoic acid biosynthesis glycosyltransferase
MLTRQRGNTSKVTVNESRFSDIPGAYSKSVLKLLNNYFSGESKTLFMHDFDAALQNAENRYKQIGVLKKLNSQRDIDSFLESINSRLSPDGLFFGFAELNGKMRNEIHRQSPRLVRSAAYFVHCAYHRVLPKLNGWTREAYNKWNSSRYHYCISKAELLGRVIKSGFEIEEIIDDSTILFFIARKKRLPDHRKPSTGVLFRMRRIGRDGRTINVYKLRTMHPYSEYLQHYLMQTNGLEEGGKFRDDFRVTSWGRILRKYWIDELPMLLNVIKGDLKLIGVRPLSHQYFKMYPGEIQRLRTTQKPGLIPPFYADMPKTFSEIVESEKRYLLLHAERPLATDLKYFVRIVRNMMSRRARSK